MFLLQLKVKTEAVNKIMLELVIINGIIIAIKSSLSKKFCFNQTLKQDQDCV